MEVRANSTVSRGSESLIYPHFDHRAGASVLVAEKGDGIRIVDERGKSYIEGVAGLWCASLGFSNERLARAAYDQLRTLPYYLASAGKSHPVAIELAEKLLSVAPANMDKIFFACSGSEANDTAIKAIWYYNNALGRKEKKKIIGRQTAYHGVTLATASLTGLAYNHYGFDLPLDRFLHVSAPNYYRGALPGESEQDFSSRLARELEDVILREGPDTVAALFAEPVMGTGGILVPPAGYFDKIQEVARRYDVLLVADEIVCGYGRTGNYWGHQTVGFEPDLISTAKGLSSAYLPISGLLLSKQVADVLLDEVHVIGGFGHNFTYTAHPAPAAVALECLKIYEEMDVVEHVRRVGGIMQDRLRARLTDHPLVGEVRGVGLLAGVEFVANKQTRESFAPGRKVGQKLQDLLEANGLILRSLKPDVMALCPPVIITEDEVHGMLDILEGTLDEFSAGLESGRF